MESADTSGGGRFAIMAFGIAVPQRRRPPNASASNALASCEEK